MQWMISSSQAGYPLVILPVCEFLWALVKLSVSNEVGHTESRCIDDLAKRTQPYDLSLPRSHAKTPHLLTVQSLKVPRGGPLEVRLVGNDGSMRHSDPNSRPF